MLLSSGIVNSQNAYASDLSKFGVRYNLQQPGCAAQEEMLKSCDESLEACKKAKDSQLQVNNQLKDINHEQAEEIQRLTEEQGSFFKSPIVWFVLGALTTSLTIAVIK